MNMKNNKEKQQVPIPIEDKKLMTDKQMDNALVDLYYTKGWKALKRFIDIEMIKAENSLCTLNLSEKLVEATRNQGIRMGLFSIIQYIETEIERRKKAENNGKGEKEEAANVPNYNY